MKRLTLFILLLFGVKMAYAGGNVFIKGRIHPLDKEISILFSPVIGGLSSPFLQNEIKTDATGGFTLLLPQDQPGYIFLESKYFRLTLYASPSDTILIDCDSSKKVDIKGGHAMENRLLNSGRFTNGPDLHAQIIDALGSNEPAAQKLTALLSMLDNYRSPVDSLVADYHIDTAVASSLIRYKQSLFMFFAFNSLEAYYEKLQRGEAANNLDSSAISGIANGLFNTLHPFDEAQPITPAMSAMLVDVCRLMDFKLIPGVMHNGQDWSEKIGTKAYYAYVPLKLQEVSLSNYIILSRKITAKPVAGSIATFKRLFPESPYNGVFASWTADDNTAGGVAADIRKDVLTYQGTNDSITRAPITSFGSISEFIRMHFKGKPVLVDCWATWCGPCKAEFKYEPALRKFLRENGVEMLYVSMDANTNETSWQSSIHEFQLEGTHICASETLLNNTVAMLGVKVMAVPRYLIYDGDGNLLEQDALRPSAGSALYEQIGQTLGKTKMKQP